MEEVRGSSVGSWVGSRKGSLGIVNAPLKTKLSTLKVELILEFRGGSITYAFDSIHLKTLNGPALRAHNFLAVPEGYRSGRTMT